MMDRILLSVYPVLFFIIVLKGVRPLRTDGGSGSFLTIRQTRMAEAAACFGVVLHHLSQEVTNYGALDKGPFTYFSYAGILFTGLFFFFSGYGLMFSLRTRADYLSGFLQRRLPAVLVPFWLCNAVIILLNRVLYGSWGSFDRMLRNLSGITLINGNGWFIIEITILYLLFYGLFSLIRNRDVSLVLLSCAVFLLMGYAFFRGHDPSSQQIHWFRGEWWYNSTVTFVLGLWYARLQNRIDPVLSRRYRVCLLTFTILFPGLFQVSVYCVRRYGYYYELSAAVGRRYAFLTLLSQSAVCIAFTVWVLLLLMRAELGNRALNALDRIRLPLFLIHGVVIETVFGNIRMNAFLRCAFAILCSIPVAAAIAPLSGRLTEAVRAALEPGQRIKTVGTLEHAAYEKARKKRLHRMKILAVLCAALLLCGLLFLLVDHTLLAEKRWQEEKAALRSASVGDHVLWGRFETDSGHFGRERLTWIVIKKEEDRICLLSEKGIAGSVYHHRHEDISWKDCDLRQYLNSETFTGMFSRYEAPDVLTEEGDMLRLLTAEEARSVFASDEERELAITEAARADGTNINVMSYDNYWGMKGYHSSWWWLRQADGQTDIYAPIVTVDGTVEEVKKVVNKPNGALRPVIWVKLQAE